MLKRIGTLVFVFILMLPCIIYAEEMKGDWYIGAGAGFVHRNDSFDEPARLSYEGGSILSIGIGHRMERSGNPFVKNLRFEVEYSRQFLDADQIELRLERGGQLSGFPEQARGEVDVEAFQLVIYYDLPLGKIRLTPYAGLGIGFNRVLVDSLGSSTLDNFVPNHNFDLDFNTDYVFCISPRLGVTYEITRNLDIFVGGRYHKSEKVTVVGLDGLLNHPNLETWAGEAGLRFNF